MATEIKVVSICTVLDGLFGGYNWKERSYEEESDAVLKWCDENDAAFYSAPRESFSRETAIQQAIAEGKSKVVVEDLS